MLIKELHSHVEENGYNVDLGGTGSSIIRYGVRIYQFDENLRMVNVYERKKDAFEYETDFWINKSLKEYCFSPNGFLWVSNENVVDNQLTNDILPLIHYYNPREAVYQFEYIDNKLIHLNTFDNTSEAAHKYGVTDDAIAYACRNSSKCKGYIWRYCKDVIDISEFIKNYYPPSKYQKPSKKVIQFDSEYQLVKEYQGASEVEELNPGFVADAIRSACSGHGISRYGYFWRYSDDLEGINRLKIEQPKITKSEKIPVYQFNIYGDLIAEYPSIDKASAVTGIPHPNIHNCCIGSYSHAGKFIWKHKEDVSDLEEFKRTLDTSIFDEFKEIYQFDMDLNFIAEYENANAATKINTKLVSNSILDCCRNIYRYSNDYIWQFKCNVPDIMAFKNEYTHKNRKPTTHSPVLQYDKNMNFIREFQSAKEAAAFYNCDSHTITYACSGRNKTGLGFIWKYKYPEQVKSSKILLQLDENMNILRSFDSVDEAAKRVGYKSSSSIRKCCTRGIPGKGFYWMYKEDYETKYGTTDAA